MRIPVRCKTIDRNFKAQLKDVSTSGVFIETEKLLQIGNGIAVTFEFPRSGTKVMVTGEVVRADYTGVGICIKIFFRNDESRPAVSH